MHTRGVFDPETETEAREAYEAVVPAARAVVREIARAMEFDDDEYDERVDSAVVGTARDTVFASLLAVHVGDSEEFESWCAGHPDYEVTTVGSEHVSRVVWHPVPFDGSVVAATFEDETEAAVATLRRQAFGRVYREYLD